MPVSLAQLARWRAEAEALAIEADDLTAFAAFADLEDAFEPVEALMQQLTGDIEWQVEQHAPDDPGARPPRQPHRSRPIGGA